MAKQTIAIGSVANDGTGDTLRAAMDKVNDNFTENYASIAALEAVTATPCCGSKYPEFRASTKFFIASQQMMSDLFYISKIENGVAGHVIIEVKRTTNLVNAGDLVMKSDRTAAAKTGWEIVNLAAQGVYGIYGTIIIDWDQLTAGVSYTCANWTEGGLFAINTAKTGTGGGGNATENVLSVTDDTTSVDGSYDQYVCKATKDITLTMNAFATLAGTVKINNISPTYHVELFAATAETAATFNGTTQMSIIIEPNTNVEVACTAAQTFIVKGTYTNP